MSLLSFVMPIDVSFVHLFEVRCKDKTAVISFLSCLHVEIYVLPILDAAILDISLPVKSNNINCNE